MPAEWEERQRPRDERGMGGDDMPPSGEEARAQRKETGMPIVWMVLGLILVVAFVALLMLWTPRQPFLKGPANEPMPSQATPPPKQITQ